MLKTWKRAALMAAFLVLFVLFTFPGAKADTYNTLTGAPPASVSAVVLATDSAHVQKISGVPPVGYASQGAYILVTEETPLPTTAVIASAAFTASGAIDTRITSTTIDLNPPSAVASTTAASSTASSANVAALAARVWVGIQNQHATCSVWLAPGAANATISSGIELKPGSFFGRPYGPGVSLPYISSVTVPISIDQESR